MLGTGASRAAKDYVCRKLLIIGTTASVPALAALLPDKELSHMGRYALERIPAPEAAEALREALAKTSGAEKSGIAGSLGVSPRHGRASPTSPRYSSDSDELVALAAATALGDIGTVESAKALQDAAPSAEPVKHRVADARLTAAEKLLAAGDRAAAKKVYISLITSPAKSVKLAATRGLLLAGGRNGKSYENRLRTGFRPVRSRLFHTCRFRETTMNRNHHRVRLRSGDLLVLAPLPPRRPRGDDAVQTVIISSPTKTRTSARSGWSKSATRRKAWKQRGASPRYCRSFRRTPKLGCWSAWPAAATRRPSPAVLDMIKDSQGEVRAAAIRALGSLGDKSDVPRLVALAGRNQEPD